MGRRARLNRSAPLAVRHGHVPAWYRTAFRVHQDGNRFSTARLPRTHGLHWDFNHFVVFVRIVKRGARIIDPALGPRVVPLGKLRQSFTGVALVFEETDAFERRRRGKGRFGWYLRQLAGQRHVLTRVIVTSVLLRVFALAVPLLTALVVDRVVPRASRCAVK